MPLRVSGPKLTAMVYEALHLPPGCLTTYVGKIRRHGDRVEMQNYVASPCEIVCPIRVPLTLDSVFHVRFRGDTLLQSPEDIVAAFVRRLREYRGQWTAFACRVFVDEEAQIASLVYGIQQAAPKPPPSQTDVFASLQQKAGEIAAEIAVKREEILRAYIAQHGFAPDETEQVMMTYPDGTVRWWVQKRTTKETCP